MNSQKRARLTKLGFTVIGVNDEGTIQFRSGVYIARYNEEGIQMTGEYQASEERAYFWFAEDYVRALELFEREGIPYKGLDSKVLFSQFEEMQRRIRGLTERVKKLKQTPTLVSDNP